MAFLFGRSKKRTSFCYGGTAMSKPSSTISSPMPHEIYAMKGDGTYTVDSTVAASSRSSGLTSRSSRSSISSDSNSRHMTNITGIVAMKTSNHSSSKHALRRSAPATSIPNPGPSAALSQKAITEEQEARLAAHNYHNVHYLCAPPVSKEGGRQKMLRDEEATLAMLRRNGRPVPKWSNKKATEDASLTSATEDMTVTESTFEKQHLVEVKPARLKKSKKTKRSKGTKRSKKSKRDVHKPEFVTSRIAI